MVSRGNHRQRPVTGHLLIGGLVMDFFAAPELRQRATWKLNQVTIALSSTWMTVVISVRHFTEGVHRLPYLLRRQLSPVRIVASITLAALVATPTTLYLLEKGQHVNTRRAYRELTVTSTTETRYLRSTVRDLLDEQSRLANLVLESGNTLYTGDKVYVKVLASGYSSTIAQCDSTPFITAANTPPRPGVLAVSQDLLREYTPGAPFAFGDRVHVYGVGYFLIEDSMNPRWTNRVDIWFPSRNEAVRFGLREAVLSRTMDEGTRVREEILSGNYSAGSELGGL
jgi:3D (Asp-Asp-Asp) domain-containing protein